jgi:hypothetical protein
MIIIFKYFQVYLLLSYVEYLKKFWNKIVEK